MPSQMQWIIGPVARILAAVSRELPPIINGWSYEVNWMGLAASWVCETAEQLEAEIGLPPGSLQTTVDLYNRHAVRGEDPLFHKGRAWVRPFSRRSAPWTCASVPRLTRRSHSGGWR